jgi:uncharacterized protein
MMFAADLPDSIPLFPLPGALLLPRAQLPLHIFEPRYLAMLDDTLKTQHRLIGLVQPMDSRLHDIGCAGRLTQFSETGDGRYMITLSGISRFRILREVGGFTPYHKADIRWQEFERDLGGEDKDPEFDREVFLNLLSRYFTSVGLSTDWESLKEADEELLINSLSMLCPFEVEEKQALLEAPRLSDRRQIIAALMEFSCRGGSGDEALQ